MKDKTQSIEIALDGITQMIAEIKIKLDEGTSDQDTGQLSLIIDNLNLIISTFEQSKSLSGQIVKSQNELRKICTSLHEQVSQNKNIEPLLEELKTLIITPQENTIFHKHTFDFKTKTHLIVWGILIGIEIIVFSLWGFQLSQNKKLKDNDLKYRFIQMHGEISREDLSKLQDLFHENKDREVVKQIRKDVEDFEYKLNEKVRLELQRNELENRLKELDE